MTTDDKPPFSSRVSFLSAMSHELRTPMNGLVGNLSFLEGLELDPVAKSALADARVSLDRLDTLIERLILLASLEEPSSCEEAPAWRPRPGEVRSMASIFEAATREFVELFEAKGLDFHLRGYRSAVRLTAGAEEIQTICRELVSNALTYTATGSVEVRFGLIWDITRHAHHPSVHIAVEDTGCGIEEAAVESLLQPFVRQETGLNRRTEGLGIGLAIVKHQVEACQGRFHIRSIPGKGTTVHVDLPIRIIPADEKRFSHEMDPNERQLRVLIVEDNAINARVVLRQLEHTSAQATWVEDGHEAVRAVRERTYDLVLMDLQMPVMDGLEATRQIRASQGPHPVIVALTANDSPEDRRDCFEVGMDGFVAKPLRPANLTALLAAFEGLVQDGE
ncbi:MAG: response regulator [Myxococcota bacterium]